MFASERFEEIGYSRTKIKNEIRYKNYKGNIGYEIVFNLVSKNFYKISVKGSEIKPSVIEVDEGRCCFLQCKELEWF